MDVANLIGRWRKTNDGSQAIHALEINEAEGSLVVRAFSEGEPWPADWDAVRAESLYTGAADGAAESAFMARWDLGPLDVVMQANLNLGLLVVACFHRFKDGSARADRFTREFFYHAD